MKDSTFALGQAQSLFTKMRLENWVSEKHTLRGFDIYSNFIRQSRVIVLREKKGECIITHQTELDDFALVQASNPYQYIDEKIKELIKKFEEPEVQGNT